MWKLLLIAMLSLGTWAWAQSTGDCYTGMIVPDMEGVSNGPTPNLTPSDSTCPFGQTQYASTLPGSISSNTRASAFVTRPDFENDIRTSLNCNTGMLIPDMDGVSNGPTPNLTSSDSTCPSEQTQYAGTLPGSISSNTGASAFVTKQDIENDIRNSLNCNTGMLIPEMEGVSNGPTPNLTPSDSMCKRGE